MNNLLPVQSSNFAICDVRLFLIHVTYQPLTLLRHEKRRVQEELEAERKVLMKLQSHREGGSSVERLQEEVKELKAIVNCNVCHNRPKEVSMPRSYSLHFWWFFFF